MTAGQLTGHSSATNLHDRGLHVFPVDHPHHPQCIGKHGPDNPCDGQRGKHPAVKWGVWAIAATPQMIDREWGRYRGLANIGISCGPSNLVVLDEDEHGELERWCAAYGFTLPDTYEVTTARGRHLYFRWDHSVTRIGNSAKAMDGFKIDVRGDGGFVLAEGSRHADGHLYTGNGHEIADLPAEVAAELLAGATTTNGQPHQDAEQAGEQHDDRDRDYNNDKIGFHHRHFGLIAYAGRLRKSGLDRAEALPVFRQRWLLCEQPEGQIPEARYHSPEVPYPVTWKEAKAKLRDVFLRYPAGQNLDGGDDTASKDGDGSEATTWEPVDLGPYLRGEIRQPRPSLGIARSDGLRLIYPGREHAILGETESGKTWWALGCVAAELIRGTHVVYAHYEEPDATSTIERLRLLGVSDKMIHEHLTFVAPLRPLRGEWLAALVDPVPSLVVHDGVNEAMALLGLEMNTDGASAFRRRLVRPFTELGAATLACDHLPMVRDGSRRDAYGSVHKGNALDGARIQLENIEPFGRGLRGVSYVYLTKDRPGFLRANGRATKIPGRTYIGVLVVDDSDPHKPLEMPFYAPKDDDEPESVSATKQTVTTDELADTVWQTIVALPDHTVESRRKLMAQMRAAGQLFRDDSVRTVLDVLVVRRRLSEIPGRRGATGYRAIVTASQEEKE